MHLKKLGYIHVYIYIYIYIYTMLLIEHIYTVGMVPLHIVYTCLYLHSWYI